MADEDWGPPFQVETSEITFESGGHLLTANLLARERRPVAPPAEGKKPKKIKEGDPEAPPRSWCILVHGLLSDAREFGDLPMELAKAGHGVLALDLAGHGRSAGPRGIYDIDAAVQAVRDAMAYLNGREEQWDLKPQQWGVIGHSTGSLVALKVGRDLHAGDVVVCGAPLRTFADEMSFIQRVGYKFLYNLRGGKNGSDAGPTIKYAVTYKDIFADPTAREAARKKGFLQTHVPLNNYPYLMKENGFELAQQVTDPTCLFLVGEKDKVVSHERSRLVYEGCGSAKSWHEVKGSGHSLFLDAQAKEAIGFVVDWVSYRLTSFNEVRPGHTKR